MKLFFHWALATIAVFATAYVLPGVEATIMGAIIAALVLAILSMFVKPIVTLLTLPINILTLGLFSLVINAGLVLATDYLVDGFFVLNFWWALAFGLVLSIINVFFGIKTNWGAR